MWHRGEREGGARNTKHKRKIWQHTLRFIMVPLSGSVCHFSKSSIWWLFQYKIVVISVNYLHEKGLSFFFWAKTKFFAFFLLPWVYGDSDYVANRIGFGSETANALKLSARCFYLPNNKSELIVKLYQSIINILHYFSCRWWFVIWIFCCVWEEGRLI